MVYILLSFALTVALIPALARVALACGLVDSPTERKRHNGDIPLVGGVAIFIAIVLVDMTGALVIPPMLLILGLLLVALGLLDDLKDLSVSLRVLVQIAVATAMVLFMDVRIERIGALYGDSDLKLGGAVSVIFTVVCTVGVINAINMIDGLDGLSGSILFISFGALAIIAHNAGSEHATSLFCMCAALAGFLIYNGRLLRKKAAVFMGDSGCMFLGLVLVWAFIELSQGQQPALNAVSAGWIFGLPLMETVAIMAGRIADGKSPFEAGRDHLHHKLLNAGFDVNSTATIMIIMHFFLVMIGFVYASVITGESVLFWWFVVLTITYFLVMRYGYDVWRERSRLKQP